MAVRKGEQRRAMFSWSGGGPTFGGGPDVLIGEYCHIKDRSFSELGDTYHLPAGYTHDTPQARSLLAGSVTFKCDEYKVFYQQ